jgi:uncharacterized membrane protein
MASLLIVAARFCYFRTLGCAAIVGFPSGQESLKIALALMLFFMGCVHFAKIRRDLAKMVPPALGNPSFWVAFTGVLEILGGAGLLLRSTSKVAAYALIALLLAMFPANVYAARHEIKVAGYKPMRLDLRILLEVVLIAALFATTLTF